MMAKLDAKSRMNPKLGFEQTGFHDHHDFKQSLEVGLELRLGVYWGSAVTILPILLGG